MAQQNTETFIVCHRNPSEDKEIQEIELQNRNSAAASLSREHVIARVCDSFTERRPQTTPSESDHEGQQLLAHDNSICSTCDCAKSEHIVNGSSPNACSVPVSSSASPQEVLQLTKAEGQIIFDPYDIVNCTPAKYACWSNECDMEDVVSYMMYYWRLVKRPQLDPDVILSVVGDDEHFSLSASRKKAILDEGLIKVVKMTNGWILSQGTNSGVSKAVGDAIREGQSLKYDENGEVTRSIHCIGITPLHFIKRRKKLINPVQNKFAKAEYPVHQFNEPNLDNLNPDHSHFLFVDGGDNEEGKKNTDMFHASLEKELHTVCPVLCLLIDGGIKTFTQIRYTLEKGTSVLICKGTGRFADILAEAVTLFKIMRPRSSDKRFRNQLSSMIQQDLDYIASVNDEDKDELFKQIVDVVVEHSNRLLVFDTDKDALDVTVMEFLLDQKDGGLSDTSRLQLALRWNAPAIAASKILSNPAFTQIGDKMMADFWEAALINDQVEFVKLFTDYRALDGGNFLNVQKLCTLYAQTLELRESLYMSLIMKKININVNVRSIGWEHIHKIIKKFIRLYDDIFVSNNTPVKEGERIFKQPFRELFIWAVLFKRERLALFFWEKCFNPLSVALLGCLLCTGMKKHMKSLVDPMANEFRILKRRLQQLAIGIVDQAYAVNREKAMLMVQLRIESMGDLNSMAVAGIAGARAYFNANCCQQVISEGWKRGFDANGGKIVLSVYLPPLLYALIHFDEDQKMRAREMQRYGYSQIENVVRPLTNAVEDSGVTMAQETFAAPQFFFTKSKNLHLYITDLKAEDLPDAYFAPLKPRRTRWYVDCWPAPFRRSLNNLLTFYASPVVKFTVHMVGHYVIHYYYNSLDIQTFYILYLALYAAVMLFYYPTAENKESVAWPEILLYVWQLTFSCEVCRSIFATPGELGAKFFDWWHNGAFGTWNRMDCLSLALSLTAFIVRWCGVIPVSRLLMLIAMYLYFQRVYKIHFVSSYLGPKTVDLTMFLLVFMVFMLSYSISVQSLFHPRRVPYVGIGWDLFQQGIWETFGEPADETMKGHVDNCTEREISLSSGTLDCFLRVYPVPIFLAIYLFFGSILLVNMLIAVFGHVFNEVHANSKEIWRYQMYFLFNEYDEKPWLPAPFIIITHACRVIKFICRVCSKSKPSTEIVINGQIISRNELKFLEIFERVCQRNALNSLHLAERSRSNCDVSEPQDT